MKNKAHLMILLFLLNCSSGEDIPSPDDNTVITEESIYTEENRWVYEQMNHNYLWRNDMPDSLACNYNTDPVSFFKSLLSSKDRFSYSVRNTDYVGGIEEFDYGFEYQKYKSQNYGEMLQVLYVTSEKLRKNGLQRGDWLKQISVDKFIRGNIECDGFRFRDTLSIESIESRGYNQNTVYLDSIYVIDDKKVGYMCYMEFAAISDLENVMAKFYEASIDDLILDFRYNPGGYVKTCRYLCNSIVSEEGYGQIFQQCTYNDILSKEYEKETGSSKTVEYYDKPTPEDSPILGTRLYGLNLKKIYVLTSKNTASASEATIICLRPYMEVVVIGEETYGKGVGSRTLRDKRYKYMLQPIIMRYYNANMETTPDDGIPTDIEVEGGYQTVKRELGDLNEPLLQVAVQCITGENLDNDKRMVSRSEILDLKAVGCPSFAKEIIEY